MADQVTVSDLTELLAQICEILKEREKSFAELSQEVAGMRQSPPTGQSIRRKTAAHIATMQQLDAIVGQLRKR
jgi:hypothetical protein